MVVVEADPTTADGDVGAAVGVGMGVAVHAPEPKSNPVAQVTTVLSVAEVHVTVLALPTMVQSVHSSALSHVPAAAQLIVHVSAAPTPPKVCFGYKQEHVARESSAVVHEVAVPPMTAVQGVQSDASSAAWLPVLHGQQVPAAVLLCATIPHST